MNVLILLSFGSPAGRAPPCAVPSGPGPPLGRGRGGAVRPGAALGAGPWRCVSPGAALGSHRLDGQDAAALLGQLGARLRVRVEQREVRHDNRNRKQRYFRRLGHHVSTSGRANRQ